MQLLIVVSFSRPPVPMVEIECYRKALGLTATRFSELQKAVGGLNRYFVDPVQLLDIRFCDLPRSSGHKAREHDFDALIMAIRDS